MAFAEPHPDLCCSLPSPWNAAWHGGATLDSLSSGLLEAPCSLGSAGGPHVAESQWGDSSFHKTRGTQNLRGCQWTLLSLSGLPAIPLPAIASTFRSSVSPVARPLSQGTSSLSPVFTLPPPYPHPHTWKCQAASFPAFTWLWLRPLLSLKVCSPPSATPVSHS